MEVNRAFTLVFMITVLFQILNIPCSSCWYKGVRLVDNKTANEGAVEIFYKNQWRLVCSEGWSKTKANVTCKTLGYSYAVKNECTCAVSSKRSMQMTKITASCSGLELSLSECFNGTTLPVPCIGHSKAAGVKCAASHGKELCSVCLCSVKNVVDCSSKPRSFFPSLNESVKRYILRTNKITRISRKDIPFPSLEELDLSNNQIDILPDHLFNNMRKLAWLDLSNNKIKALPKDLFKYTPNLKWLNISENNFSVSSTNWSFLHNLKRLEFLLTSNYIHCCYAKISRKRLQCYSAEQNVFSGCRNLIRKKKLRIIIWVILLLTLLGNALVLVTRFYMEDKNVAQKVLIMNLGVSDILMGVYLTVIAIKDYMWRGMYFTHDEDWRASVGCRAAGVLAMTSSQASLCTLVFITYDRLRVITCNKMQLRKLGIRSVCAILAVIWLTSLALSITPAVIRPYFYQEETGFYGTNSLCLPLQLPHNETPGWEYCLALFGIVNLIMSIYMAVAYAWMFISIRKIGQVAASGRMKRERTLAKRMTFLVVTDLLCWFPVIVVLWLSLSGLLSKSDQQIFSYLAVLVIPINSALNPILYTIFTPSVLNKINAVFGRRRSRRNDSSSTRP